MTDKIIERMARALCKLHCERNGDGDTPDTAQAYSGYPLWQAYVQQATAAHTAHMAALEEAGLVVVPKLVGVRRPASCEATELRYRRGDLYVQVMVSDREADQASNSQMETMIEHRQRQAFSALDRAATTKGNEGCP